ncbi:MAG: HesB/IscA family protein [Candidatus Binataceae bacterium]
MSEELSHEHTIQSAGVASAEGMPGINLTPKAVEAVRKLHEKEGLPPEQGLRVSVVGGGCSGFQYSLNFDALKDGDTVTEFDSFRVYIDEVSLPYIAGTTLDYVEGLHGAGFKFDNPRASRVCGCGSSFSA